MKYPGRALLDARGAVRQHGGRVRAAHGVPVWKQLVQAWWLKARYRVEPDVYYRYELFLPGQWRRAPQFFPVGGSVFPLLNQVTAPDDDRLLGDKQAFERWLSDRGIPSARSVVTFTDGVATFERPELGGRLPHRDLFSKPSDMLAGVGAQRWVFADGRWSSGELSFDEHGLVEELARRSRTNGMLLQERLVNHPAVRLLAPGALSTIRVITLRDLDGSVNPVLAICKLPVGQAETDHMRLGGLATPLDLESGRLGRAIGGSPSGWFVVHERHPDSHATIAGVQLPFWREVLELAPRAHAALPQIVCVGWDIAIVEDGPVVVEGNSEPGYLSSQLPTGVGLGETPVARVVLARLQASLPLSVPCADLTALRGRTAVSST